MQRPRTTQWQLVTGGTKSPAGVLTFLLLVVLVVLALAPVVTRITRVSCFVASICGLCCIIVNDLTFYLCLVVAARNDVSFPISDCVVARSDGVSLCFDRRNAFLSLDRRVDHFHVLTTGSHTFLVAQ